MDYRFFIVQMKSAINSCLTNEKKREIWKVSQILQKCECGIIGVGKVTETPDGETLSEQGLPLLVSVWHYCKLCYLFQKQNHCSVLNENSSTLRQLKWSACVGI